MNEPLLKTRRVLMDYMKKQGLNQGKDLKENLDIIDDLIKIAQRFLKPFPDELEKEINMLLEKRLELTK